MEFFGLSVGVCNFRMVQKIGFSNQNSSKSHFSENGICASTNFWRIVELFDYILLNISSSISMDFGGGFRAGCTKYL